ncbi:ComEA family DNA-binding protein [Conexibacter woesei]|uniref:ComEA family DNA-binding protein n=1 Tax=Conexibacter woesei TaxID=191495 RepID=UPI00042139AE|nr:ComEA family DNA-binding protein [Conexibacter woesei]
MPSGLSRTELVAYAVGAVLVVVVGLRVLHHDAAPAAAPATERASVAVAAPRAVGALVHVVGAVRRAGVYRVGAGKRIEDAIRLAGGATAHADLQAINLAAKVADGQQIVVPRRGAAPAGVSAVPGVAASAPVNLNTATAEQLDTLDGVGPTTAQKILAFRQQHGGFSSINDLAQIPGIGPKKLARSSHR